VKDGKLLLALYFLSLDMTLDVQEVNESSVIISCITTVML